MKKHTHSTHDAQTYDVLIAGGGPVGWAAALAAKQGLGAKAKVAVIERNQSAPIPLGSPLSSRVYTVSEAHIDWLLAEGCVLPEARVAAVNSIVCFGVDGREALRVTDRDSAAIRLARVIEHEVLTAAIAARAQALGVALIQGEVVNALSLEASNKTTEQLAELADGRLLPMRLLIAADGAQSKLRAVAGFETMLRPYEHTGVVAHFVCDPPHQGAAQQWFQADGSFLRCCLYL